MTASDEVRPLSHPMKDGGKLVGKMGWEEPVAEDGVPLSEWPAKEATFYAGRYYAKGQCVVASRAPNIWFEGYEFTAEEKKAAADDKMAEAERLMAEADALKVDASGKKGQK